MRTWAPAAAPSYGWETGMLSLKDISTSVQYGAASDMEVAASLNALTEQRPVAVLSSVVFSILLKTGDWGPLKLFSRSAPGNDPATNALIGAAITAVDAIERTNMLGTDSEEDAAVITAMMSAFVGAGLMKLSTSERLSALMNASFPVWDPPVTAEDVAVARTLTDG